MGEVQPLTPRSGGRVGVSRRERDGRVWGRSEFSTAWEVVMGRLGGRRLVGVGDSAATYSAGKVVVGRWDGAGEVERR